jgi:hypothetical protein
MKSVPNLHPDFVPRACTDPKIRVSSSVVPAHRFVLFIRCESARPGIIECSTDQLDKGIRAAHPGPNLPRLSVTPDEVLL